MTPIKGVTKAVSKFGIPVLEKAVDEYKGAGVLADSYRFMKGLSRYIPSETASGQTGMFPAGYGRKAAKPALTEAQKHKRLLADIKADAAKQPVSRPAPRQRVKALAREQELNQKAAADAVSQQFAMDRAREAGQITGKEIVKTNRILNQRRRRVM